MLIVQINVASNKEPAICFRLSVCPITWSLRSKPPAARSNFCYIDMITIAIYTSNHGFGHSTRMAALASEFIRFGIRVQIRSNRPQHLFRDLDPKFTDISVTTCDFGVKHGPNLTTDKAATRSALLNLMSGRLELLDAEISWLREAAIDLVIADIPWLAVEAASYAGIPVFAISNFDWFYIYSSIFEADQELKPVLNAIYGIYQRVDLAYKLPFSGRDGMLAFPNATKLGLLARKNESYTDIRSLHGIPATEPILLTMYGGEGSLELDLETICGVFKGRVFSTNSEIKSDRHICLAPDADFLDYIKAADIILTKPGYSSLAEAVQFGKTIVYRERLNYPEERLLIQGLKAYPYKYALPQKRLSRTGWTTLFKNIARQDKARIPGAFTNSNTEVAARIIADFAALKTKGCKLISVFDIGSNNLNYCLYDKGREEVLHRTQVSTGLARNVKHNKLKADAILRLKRGFSQIYAYDSKIISEKHVLATGISRTAVNSDRIAAWLEHKHGLNLNIIKASQEIKYVHYAIRLKKHDSEGVVGFDIGGASTEFAWQDAYKRIQGLSLDFGLLTLIQNFPDQSQRQQVITDALLTVKPPLVRTVVGIGLTVVFLEQIIKSDSGLSHRSREWGRLRKFELEQLQQDLLNNGYNSLLPYMRDPVNPDILALSCRFCILIMDRFGCSEILVCPDGISAGYARSLKSG